MKFKVKVTLKKKSTMLPEIADFGIRIKKEAKRFSGGFSVASIKQDANGFEAVITVNELAASGLVSAISNQAQMLCLAGSQALSGNGADKARQILHLLGEAAQLKPAFPGPVDQCSTFLHSDNNVHILAQRVGKGPTKAKLAEPTVVKLSEAGQLVLEGLVRTAFLLDSGSLEQFRCGEAAKDVVKFFEPVTEILHEVDITSGKRVSGARHLHVSGAFMSTSREEAFSKMLQIVEALRKLWAPAYAGGAKILTDNIEYAKKHGLPNARIQGVSFHMTSIPKIAVLR